MKHSHTINLQHNKPTPTYSATSEIWTQFTVPSAKKDEHFANETFTCPNDD